MISKALAFGLIGAGCVVAAAGGAYMAARQNAPAQPAAISAPVGQSQPAEPQAPKAVAETEALVAPKPEAPFAEPAPRKPAPETS
jgi:hypothetical protein